MTQRSQVPLLDRAPASVRTVVRAVSRPSGMVEATRWLFWLLAVISLVLSAPTPLLMPVSILTLFAGLSIMGLAVSVTFGYLTRQARWPWDLFDAAGIVGLGLAASNPSIVFALVFAMIWFRSLYGTTVHGLARCVVYGSAVVITFVMVSVGLGPSLGGDTTPLGSALQVALAAVPTMFVTVVAARHLARLLTDREQETRRDAVHAATGSLLLGVTDPVEIRAIVWQAFSDVCAVTPGLRVVGTREDDDGLVVIGRIGEFVQPPTTLSPRLRSHLEHYDAGGPAGRKLAELDAAVGLACEWRCLPLADRSGSDWLVLASPRRIPLQAIATLTTLVSQGTLALRNSHAHQELTALATQDSLTGLANRARFNSELSRTLSSAQGSGTAVLFVDLDDFKDVNDVFGHTAGDDVLCEVASRIKAATRAGDVCAGLGGDEFAVLLPHTAADVATQVGRRIVAAVAGPMPLREGGVAQAAASVGLAVDTDGSSAAQMVQRADIAMYAAKAGGKGRIHEFSTSLLHRDAGQVVFDRQLLAATANHELVVCYQPLVSVPAGRCTAVEALVRWEHPDRGLIPPCEFIAAAERVGAINDIGAFVLRQACADVTSWRRSSGGSPMSVHVNVSALQLDEDGFCTQVLDCLGDFSMAPEELVLEITESVGISSPAAVEQLNALSRAGVAIAIDDFGTGYAALTTLRQLPVSIVKIDQSFVVGSTMNAGDRALTEAVVQMATRMGLQTIAEGVERPEQQAFLESIGADFVQGFLYLRPARAAELFVWLDDNLVEQPDRHESLDADQANDTVVQFPHRIGGIPSGTPTRRPARRPARRPERW